jgi:serine/threonine protein phosphatase 1
MALLRDMSMRPNVVPILGNHDNIAYETLSQLLFEASHENVKKYFGGDVENFVRHIDNWTKVGGGPTLEGFGRLPLDERRYLIEYLTEFSLYETLKINDKKYILTHAGLPRGATPGRLGEYDVFDYVTATTDYGRTYFSDIFLVTGHLPTYVIDEGCRGRVCRKNNHIAIDAGIAFGEALACVCLETDEEFYIKK